MTDTWYRALAHRFTVGTEDAELHEALVAVFSDLQVGPPSVGVHEERIDITPSPEGWVATSDGSPLFRTRADDDVISRLVVHLNRQITRTAAGTHVVLHAAVIARGRNAVLLPAPPGAGKSTLTAHAVRSGWALGGDEHGALDLQTSRLRPVPKPLTLKAGSAANFRTEHNPPNGSERFFTRHLHLTAQDLGGRALDHDVEPRAIVFPTYAPGAALDVRELGPARALVHLRAETFNFHDDAERSFDTLVRLVRSVPALTMRYSDAESALIALSRYAS